MSRRRKSDFDLWVEVAAKLPWQASLIIAIVLFLVLHGFAQVEVERSTDVAGLGAFAAKELLRTLAFYGQFLLPLIFVLGAAISAFKGRQRKRLLDETSTGANAIAKLDWRSFEQLIGEAFRQQGFRVTETPEGPDGGVDLVLRKGSELHLVQCKHWRAMKVGVAIVRELYGVMAARGAVGGYVVTSGAYTEDAKRFAEGRNIELIDGRRLDAMLKKATAVSNKAPATDRPRPSSSPAAETASPSCPQCGMEMVRRVARKGPNQGKAFWGCSTFPQCRGTLKIE